MISQINDIKKSSNITLEVVSIKDAVVEVIQNRTFSEKGTSFFLGQCGWKVIKHWQIPKFFTIIVKFTSPPPKEILCTCENVFFPKILLKQGHFFLIDENS